MICRKCKADIPDNSIFCLYCGGKQKTTERPKRKRGNGQGCAIKKGPSWVAVWQVSAYTDENGKLRRKRKWKCGFKTKTEALAYAANPPSAIEKVAPTLRNYWLLYEKTGYKKIGQSKQCAYKIAWKRWEEIADRKMDTLNITALQSCVDTQTTTHYPAKDMKDLLSNLYKLAMAEETVRTNLSQFITLPPLNEKEMDAFTEDELKKMWKAYGNGDRLMGCLLLMTYSGMMPGELFNCKDDMIDFEQFEIVGCALKTTKRKTTPIVFPAMLVPVIQHLIETSNSRDGYILGMNRDRFYEEYHKSIVAAGIRDLPPYTCRHTTATALALGNIAPSVIQEAMRHAKFSTTQKYIHTKRDYVHAAIDSMGKEKYSQESGCG